VQQSLNNNGVTIIHLARPLVSLQMVVIGGLLLATLGAGSHLLFEAGKTILPGTTTCEQTAHTGATHANHTPESPSHS